MLLETDMTVPRTVVPELVRSASRGGVVILLDNVYQPPTSKSKCLITEL